MSNENRNRRKRSYKEENVQLKVDCLKLTDSAIRTDPIHFSNPHINKRTLKRYRKCTKLLFKQEHSNEQTGTSTNKFGPRNKNLPLINPNGRYIYEDFSYPYGRF